MNEEGKFLPLSVNQTATVLYRKTHFTDDIIFGEAFITAIDDSGEEFTDMTDESIEALLEEMKG